MEKAKVITICGSLRFQEKMIEEAEKLQLMGNCVLSVAYPSTVNIDKDLYSKEQCELVDRLHKQKISMSDAIYVINVDSSI